MYHLRKLKSMLLLLLVAVSARAQIEHGSVYNFVNVGNDTQSLAISGVDGVSITGTDQSDYAQLWYVQQNDDRSYSLRNLGSGLYLRSSNEPSKRWTMVAEPDANCKFSCTTAGAAYAFRATNTQDGWNYMHYGANQGCIVGWSTDTPATQWTVNVVEVEDAELDANWAELNAVNLKADVVATYQAALNKLFSDKACTQLKKSFASEAAVMADADYLALPATLREMVLKVYREAWTEANYDGTKPAWDAEYAMKYRVQLYEPYNEPEAAAKAIGINAHTNMNNPTGIFSKGREVMYVMVEGEIKEGASLYIASILGHNKLGLYNDGYELKQGLNAVPSYALGNNYFINYVVHTFDTSGDKRGKAAKARKLSDFPDLKIHIEGGSINGYWNKMGDELYAADTDADWDYIEQHATQTDVTVLGEYITLQFPFDYANSDDGTPQKGLSQYYNDEVSITASINSWDNVMMWERFLLGLLSEETTLSTKNPKSPYSSSPNVVGYIGDETDGGYGDYYNVHGLSFGTEGGYMYGSWDHCGYNFNTMESIIRDIPNNVGSHWGPAHEIGHQHQSLITMRGETEVSNNLFSNVVLWYLGKTTSRVNGANGSLENVLNNFNKKDGNYLTNNIWGMTQMYYKLFLYYHVLGHNPKFYPRLFEMLRHDPIEGMGDTVDGAKAQLHLYKMVCRAAEEDLTEFFRAHGLLTPLDGFLMGDYGESTYYMTQEQIDAAIAEVKANKWNENIAVLFINDATNEPVKSHKEGVENLEVYDKDDSGNAIFNAEVGNYASFADNSTPNYTYSITGNTMTMEGTGGTGFAIFNDKGEIISFSNKKTFELSDECKTAIVSGKAEVVTIKGDNTVAPATDIMDTDDTEAKYEALGELLTSAQALLGMEADANGTKPGYYSSAALEALQALYDEAWEAYNAQNSSRYAVVYDALFREYYNMENLGIGRTAIIPNSTYVLTNKRTSTKSMVVTDNNAVAATTTNVADAKQKWVFEAADDEDVYYIKNASTNTYLGDLKESTQIAATATKDEAKGYKAISLGNGVWALQCQNADKKSLNYNDGGNKVLGWSYEGDEGSHWYLQATSIDKNAEALYNLQHLIADAEALISEVGEVVESGSEKITLTAGNYYCNAPTTSGSDAYGSYDVLCDNNVNTYLHTDYSEADSEDGEAHYVRLDMGAGNTVQMFKINYTTRNHTYPIAPTAVTVEGSNDLNNWIEIAELTNLPTGSAAEYTSPVLGNGVKYRYIRFVVTSNEYGQVAGPENNKHHYFVLSEMGISKVTSNAVLNATYASMAPATLLAAYEALLAAQGVVATAATAEYTGALNVLNEAYEALLDAKNEVDNSAIGELKAQLSVLIGETNSLIVSCGTVTYTPAKTNEPLVLQITNPNGENYLSTNAQETTGTHYLSNLLDYDNANNHFHSAWSWDVNEIHHLKVDLGNGKSLDEFTFTYRTAARPYPYEIKVYGSNDNQSYTHLKTFSKDDSENRLPTTTADNDAYKELWTSSVITSDVAYRYLRFDVTNSGGTYNNANPKGEYCFTMSYFGITAARVSESYTVEWNEGQYGNVTEDILLAAYKAVQSAQNKVGSVVTEKQLQDAITALQAQKEALYNAKYPSVIYTISSNVDNGGVIYMGVPYTNEFTAPTTLTVDDLEAINVEGYVAESVIFDGTNITVTYNKVYTVTIEGGEGHGRVEYAGIYYKDAATINLLEGSFTAEDWTASTVAGYNSEVTVDHENGTVRVVYTLDKSEFASLVISTNEIFASCYDENGELKYYNSTDIESLLSIYPTQLSDLKAECDAATTLEQYQKVLTTLQQLNSDLVNAKSAAEAEAAERAELNGQLRTLVAETETLIASCYDNDVLKYVNSDYVTEESLNAVRALVAEAETKCARQGTTANEYRASISALTVVKDNFAAAIMNADKEAAERDAKRATLNALITKANELITLCETTPGDATKALINEVSAAVTSAQEVVSNLGSTVDALTSATEALQAKYGVLNAAQQSTAKTELRDLINQTTELIAQCGTYSFGEHMVKTPVALQATNEGEDCWISSNADQNTGGGSNDGGGIAALVDNNTETYFHTRWGGDIVNEAHYIQVDMGVGKTIEDFVFNYTARNGSPAPTEMTISGSNDGITFEDITRISKEWDDYNNDGTFTSEVIDSSLGYRYLRFTVTKSNGPGNEAYGEKYFFGMREFDLFSISYETSYYVESLTSYGNVTEEQFLNVAKTYEAANDLVENSYDKDELVNAKNNLQEYYNALLAAHNDYSYLPVTLTTDVENPVLYVMGSQRGAGKVLQYDSAPDHMFSIVEPAEVNVNHLFYFTKGTKKGQVYVHPFTAAGQVLAASDKTEGDAKVSVAKKEDASAMQWTFEQETIDETVWYSLKGVDAPYFSHHGGGTNKMGFYGSKDAGSRFTLTTMKYHTAKIGQYLHTSLYLDYPTIIPEGVKAYIAKNPSEEGTIDLVKLQGNVLPANTGVILYSETSDTYYFLYTDAEATDDVSENLLKGSASERYVGDETGAKKYYIFGRKDDNVGLYWARMDYTTDGSYVGNDQGTHFKASANKVYLELDVVSEFALSGFRFRIGDDETGIEGISTNGDSIIYDLYGRRIMEVVTPGIYIINGEKRYINIK